MEIFTFGPDGKLGGMADDGLTDRERVFVSARLQGASGNQARQVAGYSSSAMGTYLGNDERVRRALQGAAIDAGVTPQKAAEKLRALMDAERTELSRDGDPVNLGPDNRTQHAALDTYYKMMGAYPNPRIDVNTGTQNVLVIDSARSPLAALDPFGSPSIEGEGRELEALGDAELGIAPEDDFLIG